MVSTAFKWVYYAVLEHGSADIYFRDDQPMYTQGIHKIISDRISKCKTINKESLVMPETFQLILDKYGGFLVLIALGVKSD